MYSFRHGNTLCTFGCNPNARPGWHPTRCSALKRLPPRAHRVRPLRLHTTVVWFPPSLQPSRTHLNKNGKRSDSDHAAIHGGAEDRLSDRRTPTATHCCPESDPRGCAGGQHHRRDGVAPNIADRADSIWPVFGIKGATGEDATAPKSAEAGDNTVRPPLPRTGVEPRGTLSVQPHRREQLIPSGPPERRLGSWRVAPSSRH